MSGKESKEHAMLFSQLVLMFSATAMRNLGKLVNPATGKTEVDLPGAQFAIDMLEMLEFRTRGNLGDSEARMLGDALTSVRLNYVETAAAQPPPGAAPAPAPAAESAGDAGSGKPSDDSDETAQRFHKTYG